MDFILKILKDLYASVSPAEFVFVVIMIFVIMFLFMRLAMKFMMRANGGIFSDGGMNDRINDHLKEVHSRLDEITNKDEHRHHLDTIISKLDEIKHHSVASLDTVRSNATEVLLLKRDLESLAQQLSNDIESVKEQLKNREHTGDDFTMNLKMTLFQVQDILSKLTSQIDKIDEFARAAVPEFRSYHKELSKDISEISKDIALVENTLNSQINNNTIKLR